MITAMGKRKIIQVRKQTPFYIYSVFLSGCDLSVFHLTGLDENATRGTLR